MEQEYKKCVSNEKQTHMEGLEPKNIFGTTLSYIVTTSLKSLND